MRRVALLVGVALCGLDALTTGLLLSHQGGVETNPVLAAAMRGIGVGPVLVLRVIVGGLAFTAVLAGTLTVAPRFLRRFCSVAYLALAIGLVVVVSHNASLVAQAGGIS